MKLFAQCKTQEEADKEYRRLAKLYHPDKGGSNAKMADLTKQYEAWKKPKYQDAFSETVDEINKSFRSSGSYRFNKINPEGYTTTKEYQENRYEETLRKCSGLEAENSILKNELRKLQMEAGFGREEVFSNKRVIRDLEKACDTKNEIIDEMKEQLKNRPFIVRLFYAFFGEP